MPTAKEVRPGGPHFFFKVALRIFEYLILSHRLKAEFVVVFFGLETDRRMVTEGTPQLHRAYQLESGAEAQGTAILLSEKFVPLCLGIEYPEPMDTVGELIFLSL